MKKRARVVSLGLGLALAAVVPEAPALTPPVVINEFRNVGATNDAVELVVVADNLDMRGMILKDYSGSGTNDTGGKHTFAAAPLWSAVRAGTVVVLRRANGSPDVSAGGSDYNLDVGLDDTNYFASNGKMDIASDEIVQIKAAGSGVSNVTGAIHTFASGAAGTALYFTNSPLPRLRTLVGDTATGESAEAANASGTVDDFDGVGAAGNRAAGSLGTWNSASNRAFILTLRGLWPQTNVMFSASAATVSEGSGSYTVTVQKTSSDGNVSGAYALSGTATEGVTNDFNLSVMGFALNGAITSAVVIVTPHDDFLAEASETVVLTLTNVVGAIPDAPSVFTLTIADNEPRPRTDLSLWINEVHYNNAGADTNEGVEIAGRAGLALNPYRIVFYNGANGATYTNRLLSGTLGGESGGAGAVWVDTPSIQNGDPDGLALVSVQAGQTNVLQFLSYGGSFIAANGPAEGMQSEAIGVTEPDSTPATYSLQLVGQGSSYGDFHWIGPTNRSPGALNAGQVVVRRGGVFFLK